MEDSPHVAHPSKHQLLMPALSLDPSWGGPVFPPECSEVLTDWHCEPGALGYPLVPSRGSGNWPPGSPQMREGAAAKQCLVISAAWVSCRDSGAAEQQRAWDVAVPSATHPLFPVCREATRPALALRAAPSQQRLPALVSMPQLSAVPACHRKPAELRGGKSKVEKKGKSLWIQTLG